MHNSGKIRLSMLGLPVIESLEDFSRLTHISTLTIYNLSKNSERYYRCYEILKKNGKTRTISQPSKNMKGIQAWILNNILNKLAASTSSKGFEKNSSTLDNAVPHKNASAVLTLDIKDFFPNITRNKVFNVFKSIGYSNFISTIFTNLCVCKNSLPQGSPCSPKLSNLSSWGLDARIQGYVGRRTITYTRYADDLTFSGQNVIKLVKTISFIEKIINSEGFELNYAKTRVAGLSRAKIITGLVLSDDKIGIGKKVYKLLRAKAHYLSKKNDISEIKLVYHFNGWLAYLNSVDNNRFKKLRDYVILLIDKNPMTLIKYINIPIKDSSKDSLQLMSV